MLRDLVFITQKLPDERNQKKKYFNQDSRNLLRNT